MLTIPNIESSPTFDAQAVPDATDWNAVVLAENATAVLSGCAVTPHGGDMNVSVASGTVEVAGVLVTVNSVASLAVGAASATDRKDIVVVNNSGTVSVVAGTACGTAGWVRTSVGLPPVKPAIPANSVLLAEVYVASTTTVIASGNLIDKTPTRSSPVTSRTADPSAPTAGTSLLYGITKAGRGLPVWLSEIGASRAQATAQWAKTWSLLCPRAGSTIGLDGVGSSGSAGTVSTVAYSSAASTYTKVATAGGANAQAYVANTGAAGGGVVSRGAASTFGGFFFHARIIPQDASYANTGAGTGARLFVGVADSITNLITDAPNGSDMACFAYRNVNGGAVDTNWQFQTCDAGTNNNIDTTIAFTATHIYDLYIFCPAGGSTIYWQIDDITAGTSASGNTSSHLPRTTLGMDTLMSVFSVDAVVRTISMRNIYAELDVG